MLVSFQTAFFYIPSGARTGLRWAGLAKTNEPSLRTEVKEHQGKEKGEDATVSGTGSVVKDALGKNEDQPWT